MSNWIFLAGAVGIIASLAALLGLAMALARQGQVGQAVVCLAAMTTIIFLTLLGIEFADQFWEGRK